MSRRTWIPVIGLLVLLTAAVGAETPDQCAARLDQSIAIRTYDEAAEWWAQVQRECAPEPEEPATYDPSKPFTGLYGWSGELVFCVMSPTLNIRSSAGGAVVGSLARGTLFTVDLASQELLDGFVWAKHDKGWSALFRYPSAGRVDEFTHPWTCPRPAPEPTPTTSRTSLAIYEILRLGQTKVFQLSGADCVITANRGSSIESGKLYIAAGRLGWLRDEYMVNLYAPGGRAVLPFNETEVQDDDVGIYSHQLYTPQSTNEAIGYYTVEVATYTSSKKYNLRLNTKATYNIVVACE